MSLSDWRIGPDRKEHLATGGRGFMYHWALTKGGDYLLAFNSQDSGSHAVRCFLDSQKEEQEPLPADLGGCRYVISRHVRPGASLSLAGWHREAGPNGRWYVSIRGHDGNHSVGPLDAQSFTCSWRDNPSSSLDDETVTIHDINNCGELWRVTISWPASGGVTGHGGSVEHGYHVEIGYSGPIPAGSIDYPFIGTETQARQDASRRLPSNLAPPNTTYAVTRLSPMGLTHGSSADVDILDASRAGGLAWN